MMILDDISSLQIWRAASTGYMELPAPCGVRTAENAFVSRDALARVRDSLGRYLGDCVHVVVGQASRRFQLRGCECRLLDTSRRLPPGSFSEINQDLLVLSPALCFARLATRVDFPQLLRVGMELCGTYRKNPVSGETEYGAEPLLAAVDLREYIEQLPRVVGKGKALRAARYLADAAASPREAALCLLVVLPTKLGGYGLPAPVLNPVLRLGEREELISGQSQASCDLFWPDRGVAVEYDSDEFHTNTRAADAERRDGLEAMGYRVMTITTDQFGQFRRLDACLSALRGHLGLKSRPVSEAVRAARAVLYQDLKRPRGIAC